MAVKQLEISAPVIDEGVTAELVEGNLTAEIIDQQETIFLTALYRAEVGCANHLLRLNQGKTPWGAIDAQKAIPWVEEQTGLTLSTSQRAAIELVLQHKVAVITGGPGVGKTTLVNSILKILNAKHIDIALCAPTGRAAKRLVNPQDWKPRPSIVFWNLIPLSLHSSITKSFSIIATESKILDMF